MNAPKSQPERPKATLKWYRSYDHRIRFNKTGSVTFIDTVVHAITGGRPPQFTISRKTYEKAKMDPKFEF